MSKTKKQDKRSQAIQPNKRKTDRRTTQHRPSQKKSQTPVWIVPVLLGVTFVAFLPVFNAGFVTWDDGEYVYENTMLRDHNIMGLITTPMQGNIHPVTMLSLYLNYLISEFNPWSYHVLNLLLHLVNCYLVFRFVMILSNRKTIVAFITALLFAIHPVHVESVAWVSERKDVLYALFFLAGLITYTKYVNENSRKQYFLTILFFILSLLSKPSAVIFPLAVFCIDIFRRRKFTGKIIIEKIPFFVLSLAMGIVTYLAQKEAGSFGKIQFDTMTKMFYGFHGIMMYIVKMIIPANLAVFYPYPPINVALPASYYISPIVSVILAVLVFVSWRRDRVLAFGILFYLINLLLVLQFLPVGSAAIAHRYTYVPYIGLFFIIGWFVDRYARGNINKSLAFIVPVGIILSVITWQQAATWHSSSTLWDQAVKTQPGTKAYAIRGMLLRNEKNYDLAIDYLTRAIQSDPKDYELYSNRGNCYFDLNKTDLAFADYRKALSIKANFPEALDNMGGLFYKQGRADSALYYSSKAIQAKPTYKQAYMHRAMAHEQLNQFTEAISDYNKYLELEPNAAGIYNNISSCYQAMKKFPESLTAINTAIKIDPNPAFYLTRAVTYKEMQRLNEAKQDVDVARKAGLQIPPELSGF